jgi:hypothetical protein
MKYCKSLVSKNFLFFFFFFFNLFLIFAFCYLEISSAVVFGFSLLESMIYEFNEITHEGNYQRTA